MFLLAFVLRSEAQVPSFADTLDLLARTWKVTSIEGEAETKIRLDTLKNRALKLYKDFTYTSLQGDSIVERGIWAIDRERKWFMSIANNQPASIATITKLTAAEFKLLLEINDDKIWLTMIPSSHN